MPAPVISFIAPHSGVYVSGVIDVIVSAQDRSGTGLLRVDILVDNPASAPVQQVFGEPGIFRIDTTKYADGAHTLYARATDNASGVSPDASTVIEVTNTEPQVASFFPVSPAELMREIVAMRVNSDFVPNVVVGPMSQEQYRDGGISIVTAGTGADESTSLVIRPRLQLRCVGSSLARSEQMGQHVLARVDGLKRIEIVQPSSGQSFLVHWVNVTGGPSDHFDTAETYESLMFADAMISTSPVRRLR